MLCFEEQIRLVGILEECLLLGNVLDEHSLNLEGIVAGGEGFDLTEMVVHRDSLSGFDVSGGFLDLSVDFGSDLWPVHSFILGLCVHLSFNKF